MDLIESKKRKEFCEILYKLAKDQRVLQHAAERVKIYKEFENIYYINGIDTFRHFYSDIFSVLTQIESDKSLGNINFLGENLNMLREGYQPKNYDNDGNLIDISDSLKKLYDHVNLDISRISYSKKQDFENLGEEKLNEIKARINKVEENTNQIETDLEKINKLISRVEEIEKTAPQTEKKLGKLNKTLENSQKEYIAILGIFSAVVLAFSGAVAFSTSVLENIHQASIYRIVFVCCIIGLVVVDIIYLMFRYIDKIVHESKEKTKRQNVPIIVINVALVLIMVMTTLAWAFGLVEKRNLSINETPITTQAIEETTINSQETCVQK